MDGITKEDKKYILKKHREICTSNIDCKDCIFSSVDECKLLDDRLSMLLDKCTIKTNEEKFLEIFGFSFCECKHLSVEEENEWLSREYKEQMD